jgi:hypothetical protein
MLGWSASGVVIRMIAWNPQQLMLDLTPDWRIMALTGLLASVTVLVAMIPRAQRCGWICKRRFLDAHAGTGNRTSGRIVQALVVAQLGIAFVLAVGAVRLSHAVRFARTDPGSTPPGCCNSAYTP